MLTCGVAVGSQAPLLAPRCRWDLLAAHPHPSLLYGKDQRDGKVEDTPGGTRDYRRLQRLQGARMVKRFRLLFPHVGLFGMKT